MKQYLITIVTFCSFCLTQLAIAQDIIKDDFLVNDDAGSAHQNYPSISMDAAGNFIIVWQDFRDANGDIYFQRYNDTGAPLGINTIVNDDTGSAYQGYTSISMDGASNYVIVWDDMRNVNNDIDIYFQRYNNTGETLGVNTKVNDDVDSIKQWDPKIAMDAAGYFVTVWIDERNGHPDIYFQRFTSTGVALGVNTKVNDDATNTDQVNPSIAMDATGSFIIAWQDFRNNNWDIYYQRYTDTGTSTGVNIKVNDDLVDESQYYPSIAMDAIGGFIITWQDFRKGNWDIYFQRYNDTGTTLGVNTKVNDDAGSAYQKVPRISTNTIGDFVIVWMDYRYGQTNSDIFGRRFFSNGNPNGTSYRIVADGPNNGELSPVLYANNSDIIFSWQDNRRSEGWDIYAKIVSWNWNGLTTAINEGNDNLKDFSLSQNFPNPFNPNTAIRFELPLSGLVTLKIYDLLGNEIAVLVDEYKPAGKYEVKFSVGQESFPVVASGIYFYQFKASSFIKTKKMTLN